MQFAVVVLLSKFADYDFINEPTLYLGHFFENNLYKGIHLLLGIKSF
jgi:hypothetical protein